MEQRLANGEGTLRSYKEEGQLEYMLEGTFENFAVVGKYYYTKAGKRELREAK